MPVGVAALERVGPDGRATLAIRAEAGGPAFDVATDPQVELEDLRDRVEALGGRLTIEP